MLSGALIFLEKGGKMMKKSLVLTLVLSALLLVTVMAVSVSADASLTIGNVTFVKDAANNLVTFTVPYTAEDVDQITVIAVKGPASAAPTPAEGNIVYFNQQSSASESFTFSVALDEFDEDYPYCWIKIGGTAIATASSAPGQPIWTPSVPAVVYGDANGDGRIDATDANLVIKYANTISSSGTLDATEFPNGTFASGSTAAADVNGDGRIDATDANLIIKYANTISSSGTLDAAEFPNGKFPVESQE